MSTTDTKRIVTTLDADITPMQAKLKSLQADIDKLEKSILKIATKELGNQTPYNSMPSLQRTLSHSPDIRDALPQLQPLLASLDTAVKQMAGFSRLAGNPNAGFTSYDGVAKGGPTPESPREEAIRGLSVQRASAVMQAQVDALTKQAKGDDELRRKKSELVEQERQHLLRTVFNARSLAQMGSLATGNAGPLGRNLAMGAIQYGATGKSSYGGVFQSGLAAIKLLKGPSNATSAGAVSAAGGIGADAEGAAGGIGSLRFLGPIGALIGAAIAGEEFYNRVHTAAHVTSYDLRATAPGGLTPDQAMSMTSALGGIQGSAPQYLYHPDTGFALGHQLMQMGVGAGNVVGASKATFSLARAIGADDSQIPALGFLTGTLMGKQGQSVDQVTTVFQQLVKQATAFGVGTNKLIDSFSTLEQATNGITASIGGTDSSISGLASIQKLVGGNINAGALMAPMADMTGASAITGASLLFGGDMGKFIDAQAHSDKMWDAASRFLQGTGGKGNPMTREVDLQLMQGIGFTGLSGLAPQDQRRVIDLMLNNKGHDAQQLAEKLQKKEGLVGPDAWRREMIQHAQDQVNHLDKIKISAEASAVTLGTLHHDLRDIYGAVQPGSSSSDNPGNPANTRQRAPAIAGMSEMGKQITAANPFAPFYKGANMASMGYTSANVGSVPYDLASIPTGGAYGIHPEQSNFAPGVPRGTAVVRNFGGLPINVPNGMLAMFAAANASKQDNPYGVPLSVLLTMAGQESSFNPNASNGSHFGIGQFDKDAIATIVGTKGSPFYHQKFDPFSASQSIPAMEWFLNYKIAQEKGNMWAGVADYGEGPAYAASVKDKAQQVELVVTGHLTMVNPNGTQAGTVTIPPHHVRAPVADSKTKAHPAKSGPHQQKPAPPPPRVHRSS